MNQSKKLTIEELVSDESFQRWVLGEADREEKRQWQDWIAISQENEKIAKEASRVIELVRFKPSKLKANLAHKEQLLRKTIRQHEKRSQFHTWYSRLPYHIYFRAAAIFILAILFGMSYWGIMKYGALRAKHIVKTEFGERTQVLLPDGSKVFLNGNAILSYPKNWQKLHRREVTLIGEAFFTIVKKEAALSPVEFRVHTTDGTIRVLGTEFNVTKWSDFTRVVVSKGRVSVAVAGTDRAAVILQPNDLIEFSAVRDSVLVRQVNSEVYSSWTTDMLVFEHTPVAEITERIEHTYGLKFYVDDGNLLKELVSGKIENEKHVLLKGLASLLKRQLYEQNGKVLIK